MTSKAQQFKLDNALVAPENRRVIEKCNMRINPGMKPKEPTYQVVLDALALITDNSTIYLSIFMSRDEPHGPQIEHLVLFLRIYVINLVSVQEGLISLFKGQEFDEPPTKEEPLSFIRELGHFGEIKYITDVIVDHLRQPWRTFASIINKCLYGKVSGAEPPKSKKPKTKSDSAISSEETTSKKKPTVAKKDEPSKKKPASKAKPTSKKVQIKADRGKGDGTDFQSGVPNEQHHKTSGADKGTGTKPGVSDVPKYDSKSDKEYWGDSKEEDNDDEDDTEDDEGNDDSNDNDDDDNNGDDDSTMEYYEEEEEEKVDDEEKMDEEDDEVTKELYKDVNVEEDAHMTHTMVHDTQKTDGTMQTSSVSSYYTSKLLNLKNPSPSDNKIASLMDTIVRHEEPGKDRGTKRRKSSKEAESSRDSRSKEKKSSSTGKDASHSKHKPSGKSVHAEEPSHTTDDSRVQQNQEFDTGNNDKQPADKEVYKAGWFKKPERPLTPNLDWNKRQHVDFRPPQTWISQVAHAKEPTTSFDELINTPIDFSAFILNRLNNKDLTQAILVGSAFDLLKGTCKCLTELEYHLEEYSKATTE
nr:hypothetical protein [Tanacetum cinerariifolium]